MFKSVMVELGLASIDVLGLSRQSVDLNLNMSRSNSKEKHTSNALLLLASIVMNINEPAKPSTSPIDIYTSIAGEPELQTAANEFNCSAQK